MLTMGVATKQLEDAIHGGLIEHDGNPILDWQLSNCSLIFDRAGNRMLTKGDKRVRHKIDGVVAMAIAGYVATKLGATTSAGGEGVYFV
jgi:phage terminase large subunit-like protein